MTDLLDRLDMTVADLADDEVCVNCRTPTHDDDEARDVDGWGTLCGFCYEDMWDARIEQAR
jgi:hypothetical protein